MAAKLTASLGSLAVRQFLQSRGVLSVQPRRNRYKAIHRGKWPEEARTFQQRLDELNAKDPELDRVINIGFPLKNVQGSKESVESKERQWLKTKDKVEYAARHRELKLDLEQVKKKWLREDGPSDKRIIIDHYEVFSHLFGSAFFYNTTPMSVCYEYDEEFVTPVYYGNRIPPSEAASTPIVSYDCEPDTLWTLVMTSPDGDLQHNDQECLHWMIGNIPGSDVLSGETLCNYLQPFPVRGVGYLRYVFVLYKQDKRIDFSSFQRSPNCCSLAERKFSTLDFYRRHQDDITPACISFFQSQWDPSVQSVFHNVLEMPEPSYEFIRVPNYHPEQKRFPHRQPFNLYLDRYRDVKDIQEEVLKERLKRLDPLKLPTPPPLYPSTTPIPPGTASWLKLKMQHMRLGRHQWKDLNPES